MASIPYTMFTEDPTAVDHKSKGLIPAVSVPERTWLVGYTWNPVHPAWDLTYQLNRIRNHFRGLAKHERVLFLQYFGTGSMGFSDPVSMIVNGMTTTGYIAWLRQLLNGIAAMRLPPFRIYIDFESSLNYDYIGQAHVTVNLGGIGLFESLAAIWASAPALAAMALYGPRGLAASQMPDEWWLTNGATHANYKAIWQSFAQEWREREMRRHVREAVRVTLPGCRCVNFGDRPSDPWPIYSPLYGYRFGTESVDDMSGPVNYRMPPGNQYYNAVLQFYNNMTAQMIFAHGAPNVMPIYDWSSRGTGDYSGDGDPLVWRQIVVNDYLQGVRHSIMWNARPLGLTAPQNALLTADEAYAASVVQEIRTDGEKWLREREVSV